MKAISIGIGTYVSVLTSLYLAAIAVKQFLVARAMSPALPSGSKAAAA